MPETHPANPETPDAEATPLCLNCITPVSPLAHICPSCGSPVGQFTKYMPLEYIPFFAECMGALWRRFWFGKHLSILYRLFCCLLIGLTYPLMFLAAPLALWQLANGRTPSPTS